jgi:hypothetical protein
MSSASSSIGQANFLTVIVLIFSMMFGGLFLNNSTTTISQISRSFSFFHYGFESLFVNEFDGLDLLFNPEGFPTTRITGQVIINNYAMDKDAMYPNLWKLLVYHFPLPRMLCHVTYGYNGIGWMGCIDYVCCIIGICIYSIASSYTSINNKIA